MRNSFTEEGHLGWALKTGHSKKWKWGFSEEWTNYQVPAAKAVSSQGRKWFPLLELGLIRVLWRQALKTRCGTQTGFNRQWSLCAREKYGYVHLRGRNKSSTFGFEVLIGHRDGMEVESTWLSKSVNAGRGWWQEEVAVKEKDELNMTPAFLAWVAKKQKWKKQ